MLTRIEIDGFKTFSNFALDLSPMQVILGPNASGKSNLFDALSFLSHIVSADLQSAIKESRGTALELFRLTNDGKRSTSISLAVELLLDPYWQDSWGETVTVTHSRVRYEVEIELRKTNAGVDRLVVTTEEAKPILSTLDQWHPEGNLVSNSFKEAFFKYGCFSPWLTTVDIEGERFFELNDGQQKRKRSANTAYATVLSSITSAEYPHLFAIGEELRQSRFFQFDPKVLQRPSSITAPQQLEYDGSNLATVLASIQAITATEIQPKGAIAEIAADFSSLIPEVVDLNIMLDPTTKEYRFDIIMRGGAVFSSRVVSDGTLRTLALLTLLHEPDRRGLICFEEPENGVYPDRLKALITKMRSCVTDLNSSEVTPSEEPLSQIILNSHSPVVLSCLNPGEAIFADLVSVVDSKTGNVNRKTRMRLVLESNGLSTNKGAMVTRFEVERYLQTVTQGV